MREIKYSKPVTFDISRIEMSTYVPPNTVEPNVKQFSYAVQDFYGLASRAHNPTKFGVSVYEPEDKNLPELGFVCEFNDGAYVRTGIVLSITRLQNKFTVDENPHVWILFHPLTLTTADKSQLASIQNIPARSKLEHDMDLAHEDELYHTRRMYMQNDNPYSKNRLVGDRSNISSILLEQQQEIFSGYSD